ncbi:MAG: BrnT family toxin [Mycobacterium sp.]
MGYEFEWDLAKAAENLGRHGVSFDEASTAFADPLAMLMADPDHSADEQRFVLLGLSGRRRLLVVAFTERPPRTRLISARPATRREREDYEETEA